MATAVRTVRDSIASATAALGDAGCETPRLDAELLVADALGVARTRLLMDTGAPVEAAAAERIDERVRRRAAREPVAYILGRRAFREIEIEVDARVLIPRPETELLVELALELPRDARVHDVGTGSGAVALAVKHERPDLVVSGSDPSSGAVVVACSNAARLGLDVEFTVAAGVPAQAAGADLVVANLPYVAEGEVSTLQAEIVHHEPLGALVAGPDGLDAIREVVAGAPSGTRLALEHSPAQARAVRALLHDAHTVRDLAGRERVTVGTTP